MHTRRAVPPPTHPQTSPPPHTPTNAPRAPARRPMSHMHPGSYCQAPKAPPGACPRWSACASRRRHGGSGFPRRVRPRSREPSHAHPATATGANPHHMTRQACPSVVAAKSPAPVVGSQPTQTWTTRLLLAKQRQRGSEVPGVGPGRSRLGEHEGADHRLEIRRRCNARR